MLVSNSSLSATSSVCLSLLSEAKTLIQEDTGLSQKRDLNIAVNEMEVFLSSSKIAFKRPSDHASLHDRVTAVTDAARNHSQLKVIWDGFLTSIHGLPILYPDGVQEIIFDTTQEKCRMEFVPTEAIEISCLSKNSDQNDRDAIWAIMNEAFGTFELPPRKCFEEWFQHCACLVARDPESGSIVGLLQFEKGQSCYHINIMARNAQFAKRGIATLLLQDYFKNYAKDPIPTKLCVREGNIGVQELYKKFGFTMTSETIRPEKACPDELDCVMIFHPR